MNCWRRFPFVLLLRACVVFAGLGTLAGVGGTGGTAWAQQTVTVGSLNLSPGSELDLRLFAANGGQSDRYNVTGLFSSSTRPGTPGDLMVGFSRGDDGPFLPGTSFTLVSFNSTTFAPSDAVRFQAAPRDGFGQITGTFTLTSTDGGPGALLFTLGSAVAIPEPYPLALLLPTLTVAPFLFLRAGRKRHPSLA